MKYRSTDPPVLFVGEPESIGAYEAKTRLPELLSQVEAGHSYLITRHGRPVARLLAVEPVAAAEGVADALFAMRRSRRLGVSLRALIDEGRR
jgi:prevent-host-death family protein